MAETIILLLVGLLALWFVLWLFILLPANMATDRNRSVFVWVLISLFGSPILAILLLIALGKLPGDEAEG